MMVSLPLKPVFNNFPEEIINLPRWVLFDDTKCPYDASLSSTKASVTEPQSWTSFECARAAFEEGGWAGVGLVLNGDGLVGADVDDCVFNGVPQPEALDLLLQHNFQYIEFSPSGTGLRAFGYVDIGSWVGGWPFTGSRGKICDINIEVYSHQRYLTVTGAVIRNEGIEQIINLPQLLKTIRSPDLQKSTEENSCNPLSSSVQPLYSSVGEGDIFSAIPYSCFPQAPGTRHRCIFNLARYLKGQFPDHSPEQFRSLLIRWQQASSEKIRTKDFSISWSDFLTAWPKIKSPYGHTLEAIVLESKSINVLARIAHELGYGSPSLELLKICVALQNHHHPEPFFLSVRQAGNLLGMHFTDASKILQTFVSDKILKVVKKGAGSKASRYQLLNMEDICKN